MSGRWPRVPLGEILIRHEDWISIDPEKRYRQVTARLWGQGLALRGEVLGAEIAASSQNRVRAGQFLISKIDARHGAFGLVPDSLDGAVVSNDFPAFDVKASRALPAFVRWVSKTVWFVTLCKRASEGTTNRVRLREGVFLTQEIPLPPLDEQRRIVARLDAVEQRIAERRRAAEAMGAELTQLLAAAFRRITAGAPRARMGDVAPITRRPVSIQPDATYREIGARAFGRGLFEKPPLRGDSLTWQRLFEIQEGDLVISNIKAWEGAFAVAEASHHGTVGCHRYLTSVADPQRAMPSFLFYHLQSPEGLAQVQAASPGSADRNRTLSQERFSAIEVPLPPLDAQRWFDRMQQKARAARAAQAAAERDLDQLLPALLAEAFGSGETTLEGAAGPEDPSEGSASAETLARPDGGRAVRRVAT
jgi:type I restriction enzyme S subunit